MTKLHNERNLTIHAILSFFIVKKKVADKDLVVVKLNFDYYF